MKTASFVSDKTQFNLADAEVDVLMFALGQAWLHLDADLCGSLKPTERFNIEDAKRQCQALRDKLERL